MKLCTVSFFALMALLSVVSATAARNRNRQVTYMDTMEHWTSSGKTADYLRLATRFNPLREVKNFVGTVSKPFRTLRREVNKAAKSVEKFCQEFGWLCGSSSSNSGGGNPVIKDGTACDVSPKYSYCVQFLRSKAEDRTFAIIMGPTVVSGVKEVVEPLKDMRLGNCNRNQYEGVVHFPECMQVLQTRVEE
eukprot:TRINITY_DN66609_c0_g1_i1.p1 TRINITY_DN66609_c0_g1~~TRINITY_DN66609_c0_g1_i1.p1  ORF type:complete len:191 (+),score=24.73 TRINITY_DN66609_c0_g1_i1:104-676(+)